MHNPKLYRTTGEETNPSPSSRPQPEIIIQGRKYLQRMYVFSPFVRLHLIQDKQKSKTVHSISTHWFPNIASATIHLWTLILDSAVEDQNSSFSYLSGCTPPRISSITIPVKACKVTTLARSLFREVSPTANAILSEKRKDMKCIHLIMLYILDMH